MIDLMLFYNLLKAIPPDTHLLLVGDVDQLPSVGAGNVLRDVIRSGIGPVTRLDLIFRQAETSLIIRNAHRINHGELPDTSQPERRLFRLRRRRSRSSRRTAGRRRLRTASRSRFGLDPLKDIQVLAPMYRGPVGVVGAQRASCRSRSTRASTAEAERRLAGRLFRVGDKVIQTRNNYEKEVFNGDIGRIHSLDLTEQVMTVRDGRALRQVRLVRSRRTDARLLHQRPPRQGSEYPCVVMPGRDAALHDAPAQPAVYRRHAGETAGGAGRHAQSDRHCRPQ